jgi:PPOX class probable F420-dependent enzyme
MDNVPWTATRANAMQADEMAEFLATPTVARLATYRLDGFVHLTPVWFLFDAGRFYFTLGQRRRHLRNLKRDPRATVLVDVDLRPQTGVSGEVRAVMCCGTVEISDDPEQVESMESRIDRRYLGTLTEDGGDVALSPETYELVVLTPATILTWDFSKS